MPVMTGKDSQGSFKRWGSKGHKYRYKANDKKSMSKAIKLASKQGKAIKANKG